MTTPTFIDHPIVDDPFDFVDKIHSVCVAVKELREQNLELKNSSSNSAEKYDKVNNELKFWIEKYDKLSADYNSVCAAKDNTSKYTKELQVVSGQNIVKIITLESEIAKCKSNFQKVAEYNKMLSSESEILTKKNLELEERIISLEQENEKLERIVNSIKALTLVPIGGN